MTDANPINPIHLLTSADLLLKQCLHDITEAKKAGMTPDIATCPEGFLTKGEHSENLFMRS